MTWYRGIPELFKSELKQSKAMKDEVCTGLKAKKDWFQLLFQKPKIARRGAANHTWAFWDPQAAGFGSTKSAGLELAVERVGASLHCIMCKTYWVEIHVAHSDLLDVLHPTTEEPSVSFDKRRMLHPTCWSRWLMRLKPQNFCGDSCP